MKRPISLIALSLCLLFHSPIIQAEELLYHAKYDRFNQVYCSVENATTIPSNHWSYEGNTGPINWGGLNPAYRACSNGLKQSPINIDFSKVKVLKDSAKPLSILYQPTPVDVLNTGNTIQAHLTNDQNRLNLNGNQYTLQQFHFHTPSEHKLNGKHQEMELHLVHQDENGKIAVLGILITEGSKHKTLDEIWKVLPAQKTKDAIAINQPLQLNDLLPKNQTFFLYEGSLTTPPCTENVHWVVFKESIEMSKSQIEAFQKIFPDNHRPIQPINDRDIFMKKVD